MRARALPGIVGGLALCALGMADDQWPPAKIKVGNSAIEVKFTSGKIDLPRQVVLDWISNAARAVAEYFGRFPLPHPRIEVQPAPRAHGVFGGTTWGYRGGFTRISVGQRTDRQELDNDWMMTHELTHMAFPDIEGEDNEHHWLEEGMATYIEPIARCQIGLLNPERVWGEMAQYMPEGQPQYGDRGLDNTHTWGRTYWGGALFLLLADIKIREQTHNRKGLQDAMRAIVQAGGDIREDWPIENTLKTGDRATGRTVLMDLYNQMKSTPVQTDLNDLWRRLGVAVVNDKVVFNDNAPLANIRKAITAPRNQ